MVSFMTYVILNFLIHTMGILTVFASQEVLVIK